MIRPGQAIMIAWLTTKLTALGCAAGCVTMGAMLAEPAAVVAMGVVAWVYWRGRQRMATRSRRSTWTDWKGVAFAGGLASLVVALESPLDGLSDRLFAAHMVQHLILLVVAPPLLVLANPVAPLVWGMPETSRAAVGRGLRKLEVVAHPVVAFSLHSLLLWLWHIPTLYDAALANRSVHILEHVSFLTSALVFWWAIRRPSVVGMVLLLALTVEGTVLGALLTFSDRPWYAIQAAAAQTFGVDPLQDQQVAGLIMWVPGGVVYLGYGLTMLAAWLKPMGRRVDRRDPAARTPARQ